jgi:hypothetical protein
MREYITEQELVASTLYESIFEKGEARGKAQMCAETIIQILTHWMGAVTPDVRERIKAVADLDTLKLWQAEAVVLHDAERAERLAEKILKARLS